MVLTIVVCELGLVVRLRDVTLTSITVEWDAPTSATVTSYTVTPTPRHLSPSPVTVSGTRIVMDGLLPRTRYTFLVSAIGAAYSGSQSIFTATPTGTSYVISNLVLTNFVLSMQKLAFFTMGGSSPTTV